MKHWILATMMVMMMAGIGAAGSRAETPDNFRRENLVPWCIVPFDAAKRGPVERAEMLRDLGLRRCAYDWRKEHVDQFEDEILAYREHGIEFFAFWDMHEQAASLFREYEISPQIWFMGRAGNAEGLSEAERLERSMEEMLPVARQAMAIGSSLGIYNHGGWTGHPDNMIAMAEALRKRLGTERVGIVYNFHHGHDHVDDFAALLERMLPYLLCLNLNGMEDLDTGKKILPIGSGEYEKEMIRVVLESGYDGPIGILDHLPEQDARVSLVDNLEGLEKVLRELGR